MVHHGAYILFRMVKAHPNTLELVTIHATLDGDKAVIVSLEDGLTYELDIRPVIKEKQEN